MINSLQPWRARWGAFFHPIDPEKAALRRARWESLPPELQTGNQVSGKHLTHCGFITGASYCSFRCTHCCLPENANAIPIPDVAEMFDQIDANLRFQGPGGGLQIPGGDVIDAYWRAGRTTDADPVRTGGKKLLAWRVAGALARHPLLLAKAVFRLVALAANRKLPLDLSLDLLRGQAHTVNIGTHNFMDTTAVAQAESDPVVRTRLQGCVFKGAVRNGATGEWEAVSKCLMNQSRWQEVFSAAKRRRSQ